MKQPCNEVIQFVRNSCIYFMLVNILYMCVEVILQYFFLCLFVCEY